MTTALIIMWVIVISLLFLFLKAILDKSVFKEMTRELIVLALKHLVLLERTIEQINQGDAWGKNNLKLDINKQIESTRDLIDFFSQKRGLNV